MSRAARCRDEALQADRMAKEAKFAEIRVGYQRSAANWRRLATFFDGMEGLAPDAAPWTLPPAEPSMPVSGLSGEAETGGADGESR